MADGSSMTYMMMPLTAEETQRGGDYLGLRYAIQHKDRWVDVTPITYELQTYERGFTHISDGTYIYMIHRDIMLVDEMIRLYICRRFDDEKDTVMAGAFTKRGYLYKAWSELVKEGVVTTEETTVGTTTGLKLTKCEIGTLRKGVDDFHSFIIPEGIIDIAANGAAIGTVCDTLTLPKSLLNISEHAFGATKIRKVIIQSDEITIAEYGFAGMDGLEEVEFRCKKITLGDYDFEQAASLKVVNFGDAVVEKIGDRAFSECVALKDIKLPRGLKTIGEEAFHETGLRWVAIPHTVTTIGKNAFADSTSASIDLPDTVESVGEGAFSGCRHLSYKGELEGAPWGAVSYN